MVTGNGNEQVAVVALKLGAVDYVVKPFNAHELLARVNTHLTIDRLHRENERLLLNILPAPVAERLLRSNLRGADLAGAFLEDANLAGADLTGARLTAASLSGVDLSGASGLTQAQLDQTCTNATGFPDKTRLPEGLTLKRCP